MKTNRPALAAVALFLACLAITPAVGAEPQEFPKPGPEHAQLKQMAGEWDGTIKCHLQPEPSKGTLSAKLDVGGFFLVTEVKSEILGLPFHGRGFSGYDPFKQKYVGVWVDSMSPTIYTSEGEFDEAGKVFKETMVGAGPDGKPMKMRMVTEIKDEDHMTFQIHGPGEDGQEMLMMDISYTRKK